MSDIPEPPSNPEDGPPTPRKLTLVMIEGLVKIILRGNFRLIAAKRMGVGNRTFQRWMKLGKQFPTGIYGTLRRSVLEAEAKAESRTVARILKAGKEIDPKYLGWWLERKFPQRWGANRGELGALKQRIAELEKLVEENESAYPPVEQSS